MSRIAHHLGASRCIGLSLKKCHDNDNETQVNLRLLPRFRGMSGLASDPRYYDLLCRMNVPEPQSEP